MDSFVVRTSEFSCRMCDLGTYRWLYLLQKCHLKLHPFIHSWIPARFHHLFGLPWQLWLIFIILCLRLQFLRWDAMLQVCVIFQLYCGSINQIYDLTEFCRLGLRELVLHLQRSCKKSILHLLSALVSSFLFQMPYNWSSCGLSWSCILNRPFWKFCIRSFTWNGIFENQKLIICQSYFEIPQYLIFVKQSTKALRCFCLHPESLRSGPLIG